MNESNLNHKGESPMERFENLAKRLFAKSKDEAKKLEEETEIVLEEAFETPKTMPDE